MVVCLASDHQYCFLSANNFMTAVKKVNREDLKNIANKDFSKR
jgi:hypothetical protein